jgi:hypothetical protein
MAVANSARFSALFSTLENARDFLKNLKCERERVQQPDSAQNATRG